MIKIYSGIGSRETPYDVLYDINQMAYIAAKKGWILRSGGAQGADTAFEEGCDSAHGKKEIYLPWKGFNGNTSSLVSPSDEAFSTARIIHPAYDSLIRPVKLLLARNMHQILGEDLNTPVRCVICWTSDGCESHKTYSKRTGGTGSAIALASKQGIPVFNICNEGRFFDAIEFLLDPDKEEIYEL